MLSHGQDRPTLIHYVVLAPTRTLATLSKRVLKNAAHRAEKIRKRFLLYGKDARSRDARASPRALHAQSMRGRRLVQRNYALPSQCWHAGVKNTRAQE